MTHCQIFYPFDNEDGYISVVCHREQFLENLLSLGWQKTAAEAIAVRDELTQQKAVTVLAPNCPMASDEECLDDYEVSGPENEDGTIPISKKAPEATQVVQALAQKAKEEGIVNFYGDKSRKKLSLKK